MKKSKNFGEKSVLCSNLCSKTYVLERGRTHVLKIHVQEHNLEHDVQNMAEHMFRKIMFRNMILNMNYVHVHVLFMFLETPEHGQLCLRPFDNGTCSFSGLFMPKISCVTAPVFGFLPKVSEAIASKHFCK